MKKLGFDLILLGDPAAGKDTQAALLRKKFPLKAVESGKHWRRKMLEHSPEGVILRRTSGKGLPTPVSLMKKFLLNSIRSVPRKRDLIFIGNPRLKPEAQLLVKLLRSKKRDFLVLHLSLPEKEILRRTRRRMRDLQDAKYVQNRIKYHKTQVAKTIEYFESLNKLRHIKGNQAINQVAKDITKAINAYQKSRGN